MRNAFAQEITELANRKGEIVLLSGDIGNRLFDQYKELHKNRFFNCGVAEANMASMAAGLAMVGLQPITYTIAAFNTIRCLEQIRVDICYHNLPVVIVGVGSGLSYASLGCTHHCLEDIAHMRSIPNLTVICPADSWELKALLRQTITYPNPVYLRLGKKGEPNVYDSLPDVKIGKVNVLQSGKKICLFSTGTMVPYALEAVQNFPEIEVVSMHTIKPIDEEYLLSASKRFSHWISLEEHSRIGGLSSALSDWLIDHSYSTKLFPITTPDLFPHPIGSQSFLREKFGIDISSIKEKIVTIQKEFYEDKCCHTH